jgi:5'-3' exonuclease
MGVTGDVLVRILRTAGREIDLSKYQSGIEDSKGKRRKLRPLRIGLDVSGWISRAAHGHGGMLLDERHLTNYGKSRLERGEETEIDLLTSQENRRDYIETCSKKVLNDIINLQHWSKADVLVVLDGASPPIKKIEVKRRREKMQRAQADRDAKDPEKTLDRRIKAARAAGSGAAHGLIVQELLVLMREKNIPFMVSPFEADGQLAYLAKTGLVDMVMTEDSDLLCHDISSILFKYDRNGGGMLVQKNDLGGVEYAKQTLSLLDFSTTMISVLFVCVGCDYCDKLEGIGSVTARNLVRDAFLLPRENSETPVLKRVFELLYENSKSVLSDEEKTAYEDRFMGALLMYQHPVIFCPLQGKCILINNPPHGSDPVLLHYEPYSALCHNVEKHQEILGSFPERRLQIPIIEGWVSPRTFKPYPEVALPAHVRALFGEQLQGQQSPVSHRQSEPQALENLATQNESVDIEQPETQCFQEQQQPTLNEHHEPEGEGFLRQDEPMEAEQLQTEGEQEAAEDTQEGKCWETQDSLPDTQYFNVNEEQGGESQYLETQALLTQRSSSASEPSASNESNLAQYQQPSQVSELQHPSQSSNEGHTDGNENCVSVQNLQSQGGLSMELRELAVMVAECTAPNRTRVKRNTLLQKVISSASPQLRLLWDEKSETAAFQSIGFRSLIPPPDTEAFWQHRNEALDRLEASRAILSTQSIRPTLTHDKSPLTLTQSSHTMLNQGKSLNPSTQSTGAPGNSYASQSSAHSEALGSPALLP